MKELCVPIGNMLMSSFYCYSKWFLFLSSRRLLLLFFFFSLSVSLSLSIHLTGFNSLIIWPTTILSTLLASPFLSVVFFYIHIPKEKESERIERLVFSQWACCHYRHRGVFLSNITIVTYSRGEWKEEGERRKLLTTRQLDSISSLHSCSFSLQGDLRLAVQARKWTHTWWHILLLLLLLRCLDVKSEIFSIVIKSHVLSLRLHF